MTASFQTQDQTQLTAATALVQLLAERPDLSEHITWSIGRTGATLVGFIHDGGMPVLADCAEFLGGSVRADDSTYQRGDQWMRTHVLTSTWRDAAVQLLLPLPVATEAAAA
jgi:hypothetical protein